MSSNLYLKYMYNYVLQKVNYFKWNVYFLYNRRTHELLDVSTKYKVFTAYNKLRFKNNNRIKKELCKKDETMLIVYNREKNQIYEYGKDNFDICVPGEPILEIYLESEEGDKVVLEKLGYNLFNIDKNLSLSAIIQILEEINIFDQKFKYIRTKYVSREESLKLEGGHKLGDLL